MGVEYIAESKYGFQLALLTAFATLRKAVILCAIIETLKYLLVIGFCMKLKTVLCLNMVVFSLVFVLHLLRILFGVDIMIGLTPLPQIVSVFAVLFIGILLYGNYKHWK
jgi:hypothetical protein